MIATWNPTELDIAYERYVWELVVRHVENLVRAIDLAPQVWNWGDGNGGCVLLELERALNEVGLSRFPPKTEKKTPKAPPIPWATRYRIMERDGFQCVVCGAQTKLTMDHIVPQSAGGGNEDDNLQTLCRPCNTSKGKKPMAEWRP